MLDFFDNLEKKKAFKKALQEIKEEDDAKSKNTVTRVYGKNEQTTRYNGHFSKPATEVVDLKHFKDWRKVDKVESKNPVYDLNLFESPLKKVEPEQKKAEPVFKGSSVSNYISKQDGQDRKTYSDFDEFFAKRNIGSSEKVETKNKQTFSDEEVAKAKNTFSRMFEDVERKRKAKKQADKQHEDDKDEIDLILSKMEEKKTEQKLPEVKVEVEDKIKEEPKPILTIVAKPEQKHEETVLHAVQKSEPTVQVSKPAVAKKVVNRKPRGKNKRRFDADVIGSVDWR